MAKCVKYYEGKGFQLAKSSEGYWFVRTRYHHSTYGWQWTKWDLFEYDRIKKTTASYENMNGNEMVDKVIWVIPKVESKCLSLVNSEIEAYRESRFRLPDMGGDLCLNI